MSADTTTETELAPEEWGRLLGAIDGPATFGTVARALEDARDLPGREAAAAVEAALEADVLAERDPDRGQYPVLRLADEAEGGSGGEGERDDETDAEATATTDGGADRRVEAGTTGATPTPGVDASGSSRPETGETDETGRPEAAATDTDVDVTLAEPPAVEAGVFPTDLRDEPRWHTWKATDDGRKVPRAPYAHPEWPDKFVSAQDRETWTDYEMAAEWAEKLDGYGLAFNIRGRDEHPDEEYVLVDYDDARDPETGAIHPTVREHLERAGSYADVSTSGTGVHIFCRGELPEGVKAVEASLPEAEGFDGAEIEVYDSARFTAMTGDHLAGTPTHTAEAQDFLESVAEEYATVAAGTPDQLLEEPEKSRAELADVETTTDIQDVLDAIQHVEPDHISLRSTVTQERADGTKSLDPAWASSASGTRLAQVGDGWVYRKGMVGLDALQVVALEERIVVDVTEYPSGKAFWQAVEALRERGAHIPEFQPEEADTEHTAVLPDDEALDTATSGWDWRHAAERDDDALTVDEARERTREEIARAYQRGDDVLVEALPTMGKSYGAVAAAADTDTQVTVLTTRGRKEQYGQLREWAEEHGLSHYTLPSFTRDCLTAAGEHGDEWKETVLDWYRRGATPKEIHKSAEYVLGRPLPCQEHEGQRCPYASKWDFDPDEYDVLLGHYSHAYKAKVTAGRAVAVDEFPAAYETVFAGQLQPAVSRYLETTPELPFEDYTDLLEHRDDPERRAEALAFFDDEDALEPAEADVLEDDHAHAAAPLATFTTLAAEDLGNGLERVEAPNGWVGVRNRRTDAVTILRPPEPLEYATAVVGLDGTPTPEMWNLAVGQRLAHRAVLDDDEKQQYVDEALNLNLVRTTEYVKPYNSAEHVNPEADGALFEAIAEQHGQAPAVITSATAEGEYRQAGVDELVAETKHYGNVLGSNAFAEERVGAVVGSNHYGDDFIQKWGAYAGRTVERDPEAKGAELSYGRFGDKVLTHMREHDTLQAAMRFGRDGNGAVVYVHTNTLPEWVPLAGEGRVLTTWSDGMRAVVDALEELGSATTAELVEHTAVDLSRRQVFDHLETLRERGVLAREQDPEDGRRVVWQDDELHRLGEHGEVELAPVDFEDLGDAEVAEVARSSIYTWEFRNRGGSPGRDTAAVGEEAGSEAVAGGRGGGPAANGTD